MSCQSAKYGLLPASCDPFRYYTRACPRAYAAAARLRGQPYTMDYELAKKIAGDGVSTSRKRQLDWTIKQSHMAQRRPCLQSYPLRTHSHRDFDRAEAT